MIIMFEFGGVNIYIYIYINTYKQKQQKQDFPKQELGKDYKLGPSRSSLETKGKFKASKKISYENNLKGMAILQVK